MTEQEACERIRLLEKKVRDLRSDLRWAFIFIMGLNGIAIINMVKEFNWI